MPLVAPLPTRTDSSIGRNKIDVRIADNLNSQIPAAEMNRTLDYIVALAETVGLSDGSTPGSVIEELDDHEVRITALEAATPAASRHTAGVVVGISTSGDTADICDYLDTGNGVLLQTAVTTAIAANKDVYVRPGTINLSAGPITFPDGSVVRFSGLTNILPSGTDRRAAIINPNSHVEDLHVVLPIPSIGATGSVVVSIGTTSKLIRPVISYTYTPNAGNMANESIRYGIDAVGGSSLGTLIDQPVITLPSFENVGSGNDIVGIRFIGGSGATLQSPKIIGCDFGVYSYSEVHINMPTIDVNRRGVQAELSATATGAVKITGGTITLSSATSDVYGVVLADGVAPGMFAASLNNTKIVCSTLGLVGSFGVHLFGDGVAATVTSCVIDGFPIGISADSTQTHVSVLGNIVRHPSSPLITNNSTSGNTSNNILI